MPSSEHESPIALANLEPGLIAWLLATVFEVNVGDVSAALVVYCEKPGTACRYRERLSSERLSLPLRPFIFTPEDVPVAVDSETARRNPAVVVLSALCHGSRPGVDGLFPVLAEALQAAGPDKALLLYDVVLAGLPAPVRARWETFMTTTENYEYHSELFRTLAAAARAEGEAEGEARGEAEAVLIVLEGRGMGVPDEVRDRILACTDLEQLQAWLRRAVTAETIEDVITD